MITPALFRKCVWGGGCVPFRLGRDWWTDGAMAVRVTGKMADRSDRTNASRAAAMTLLRQWIGGRQSPAVPDGDFAWKVGLRVFRIDKRYLPLFKRATRVTAALDVSSAWPEWTGALQLWSGRRVFALIMPLWAPDGGRLH